MLWAPSMALLSDGAEALGIAQGFAFALSNLGWSIGQTAGSAASARAGRRDERRGALWNLMLAVARAAPCCGLLARAGRTGRARRREAGRYAASAQRVSAAGPAGCGPG